MGNCCRRLKGRQFTEKEGMVLPHLSEELITQVLMWLPVKSLLRFRCVSKLFCYIIDSQYFINLHLRCSSLDRSSLKLIFKHCEHILTNHNGAKIDVSEFGFGLLYGLDVSGYCNGVFLLLLHRSKFALWNPSTQQCNVLPCIPGLDDNSYYHIFWMGLGYDSSQDEYKIVVINRNFLENDYHAVEHRIWIFGLRSNSWRRVCTDFLSGECVFCLSYVGYFADGNLHWLFGDGTNYQNIVAFDMVKESFSILTEQPAYDIVQKTYIRLDVLDGCLCMGFYNVVKDLFYVREKDGEEFTWSLLYSVEKNRLPGFLKVRNFKDVRVLGYSTKRDKIMLHLGLEYVVSYDIKKKSFRPTRITIPFMLFRYKPMSFVESLVSVHASDH